MKELADHAAELRKRTTGEQVTEYLQAHFADRTDHILAKAKAEDRGLICWAMCVQDATWDEWNTGVGEVVFCGLRYATRLDDDGCPILSPALRAAIVRAKEPATPALAPDNGKPADRGEG